MPEQPPEPIRYAAPPKKGKDIFDGALFGLALVILVLSVGSLPLGIMAFLEREGSLFIEMELLLLFLIVTTSIIALRIK